MKAMNDDGYLLRQFAEKRDESSFRELVERRIGFVYAVNLRRLRSSHLAQEATQSVFIALARKARTVASCPSVVGWLHRSSCYESHNMMRAQANRLTRETEALSLGTVGSDSGSGQNSEEVGAVLDELLNQLPTSDREAILARFFTGMSYADLGASTGVGESAARMRVERALLKLRKRFQHHGIDSTAAVLAGVLPTYASANVPLGMVTAVTNSALSGLAALSVAATFIAIMNTTKITATVGAIAAIGVIGFEITKTNRLERELVALRGEHALSTNTVHALEQQVKALTVAPVSKEAMPTPAGSRASPSAVKAGEDVPGITKKAPAGWHKNGSDTAAYDVGVDQLQSWGGMPSAYVKSTKPTNEGSFGGMMQSTSAENYQGKRVKLTGWVKTEDANDGGQLWLRIDAKNGTGPLGFDNMNARAPKGTTDWQEYAAVLDVPAESSTINYGFFIKGSGKMWVNGLTIQPVGNEVPTTNMLTKEPIVPKDPVNLGFAPK